MCKKFKYVNAHCAVCLFSNEFCETKKSKKPLKFGFMLDICLLLVSILQQASPLFYSLLEVFKFCGALKWFCVSMARLFTVHCSDPFSAAKRWCVHQHAKCNLKFCDEYWHCIYVNTLPYKCMNSGFR